MSPNRVILRPGQHSESEEEHSDPTTNLMLWLGILAGPLAWALHLQISYALVLWVCKTGHDSALHVTSALCLVLALAGGFLSWRALARPKEAFGSSTGETDLARCRFMGGLGIMSSALFALIIVAQAIPSFILSPCQF